MIALSFEGVLDFLPGHFAALVNFVILLFFINTLLLRGVDFRLIKALKFFGLLVENQAVCNHRRSEIVVPLNMDVKLALLRFGLPLQQSLWVLGFDPDGWCCGDLLGSQGIRIAVRVS